MVGLISIIKDEKIRTLFGKRELEIIEKQLLGIKLSNSEKTRLSRDIRKKFEAIKEYGYSYSDLSRGTSCYDTPETYSCYSIPQWIHPLESNDTTVFGIIDSYKMAAASIDSALRSAVTAGGDIENMAILDNFCWCDSTNPIRLGQLKEAVRACYDYAVAYETPFISGKDSMFNDFKGFDENGNKVMISVPPTLLISTIGVMKDAERAISLDFKFAGDLIYVLGDTFEELGGSEYFAYLSDKDQKSGTAEEYLGNKVPNVDAIKNRKLYKDYGTAVNKEIISSAISIGRGGLAVALSKSSIGGKLGAEISLKKISRNTFYDDLTLFSESQGRILVSINPKNKKEFEKAMKNNAFYEIGKVGGEVIKIFGRDDDAIVDIGVSDALECYKSTFKNY